MKWGVMQRRPVPDMRHEAEAIMAKVRATVLLKESGCWEWQGGRNQLGYGRIYWKGRVWATSRLVYCAIHGTFDKDLDMCHTCDNPPCVNPQHLWVGEHRENLKDGGRKKRLQGQWKVDCKRGHPLSGDNLYVDKLGLRHCKTCARLRNRKYAEDPNIRLKINLRRMERYHRLKAAKTVQP